MKNKLLSGILILSIVLLFACHSNSESKSNATFKMPVKPVIVMETNSGTIKCRLFPEIAPLACENMIRLAEKGYYNGIIFHRVIKEFMIQGGDPTGTGRGGESIWNEKFKDEFSSKVLFDDKGLLAMANSGPKTNGSQFFITTKPTPWLNFRHTIFGKVISGYDIVQKIENTPTDSRAHPRKTQKIVKMYLETKKEGTKAKPARPSF